MAIHFEDKIEEIRRQLESLSNEEYFYMYKDYPTNKTVKDILATIHYLLISEFNAMNTRLPTFDYEAHFWADDSRKLIAAIETSFRLRALFLSNGIGITIDDYYVEIMEKCRTFLSPSGGSTIPPHMDSIDLYYKSPIFILTNSIELPNRADSIELEFVGGGSYAEVYKFYDPFYEKTFALKKARVDLTEKELIRFENEYKELKKMNCTYVVEVYSYNKDKKEYIMEYLNCSIFDYYAKHKNELSLSKRKGYIVQFLRGMDYIHSKNLFHRDLSPTNVLVKKYDNGEVIKITDFGLVKTQNSDLTSLESDIKGYFNDPSLVIDSFANYSFEHEIYAITRMCVFFLTGLIDNYQTIKNPIIRNILAKGTNPDKTKRYKDIKELLDDINKVTGLD